MVERALHFDGPMVVGGLSYELGEVAAGVSRPRLSTGFGPLDEITGGVGRGELWVVTGPSGAGVTALCSAIAAAASEHDAVVVCNGHVPSKTLAERLSRLGATDRLFLASWLPTPVERPVGGLPGGPGLALGVIDTWDETMVAGLGERSYTSLVDELRKIRYVTGASWTSLILTARVPACRMDEPLAYLPGALHEAAHVSINLHPTDEGKSQLIVRVRGRAPQTLWLMCMHGTPRVITDL